MTSMQAVSGAGWPGTPSLDVLGNVVPFIRDEEGKVEEEIPKLLGRLGPEGVRPSALTISALCHRVPVLDGHTEAVDASGSRAIPRPTTCAPRSPSIAPEPQRLELPSAPAEPIWLHDGDDRPQARRDVETGGGMPVHVGRVRRCPGTRHQVRLLGHNTERGAAGGAVLNAELAQARRPVLEAAVSRVLEVRRLARSPTPRPCGGRRAIVRAKRCPAAPLVVLSAMAGVTDALFAAARAGRARRASRSRST